MNCLWFGRKWKSLTKTSTERTTEVSTGERVSIEVPTLPSTAQDPQISVVSSSKSEKMCFNAPPSAPEARRSKEKLTRLSRRWELSGEQEVRRSSTSPIHSGLVLKEPKNLVGKTIWVKRIRVGDSEEESSLARTIATNIDAKFTKMKHPNLLRYRGCVFDAEEKVLEIYTDAADHFGSSFENRKNEKAMTKYVFDLLQGMLFLRHNGVPKIGNIDFRNTVFDLEDNIKIAWFAENEKIFKLVSKRLGSKASKQAVSNDLLSVRRMVLQIFEAQILENSDWPRFTQKLVSESSKANPDLEGILSHPVFTEKQTEDIEPVERGLRKMNTMGTENYSRRNLDDVIEEEYSSEEDSAIEIDESNVGVGNAFIEGLQKLFQREQPAQKSTLRKQRDKAIRKLLRQNHNDTIRGGKLSPLSRLPSGEDAIRMPISDEHRTHIHFPTSSKQLSPITPFLAETSAIYRRTRRKSIDDTLISSRPSNDESTRVKLGFLSPFHPKTSIRANDRSKLKGNIFNFCTKSDRPSLQIQNFSKIFSYSPVQRCESSSSLLREGTSEAISAPSARTRWRFKHSKLLREESSKYSLGLPKSFQEGSHRIKFNFF